MASEIFLQLSSQARIPAYVHNLSFLPREIVHQIVDDLTYIKILQILSHNIPYLNECIITHLSCRNVFESLTDLSETRSYFVLYREICNSQGIQLAPKESTLSDSIRIIHNLRSHLRDEILSLLKLARYSLDMLSNYIPLRLQSVKNLFGSLSLHTPFEVMNYCWALFKSAEQQLNAFKSRQLTHAAEIMEQYPGKVLLKQPFDPSQEGPRLNTAHIAKRFRSEARKVLKDRVLIGHFHAKFVFSQEHLPLVPYDRCLATFLKAIDRLPTGSGSGIMTLSKLSIGEDVSDGISVEKPLETPPDILADITTVLDGLNYIYTNSRNRWDAARLPCRIHPPMDFSDSTPGRIIWPKFVVTHKERALLHNQVHSKKAMRPHDEREYEWLDAFLRVLDWIEKTL